MMHGDEAWSGTAARMWGAVGSVTVSSTVSGSLSLHSSSAMALAADDVAHERVRNWPGHCLSAVARCPNAAGAGRAGASTATADAHSTGSAGRDQRDEHR